MDWTSLLMIETVVGFLGIFALHLLWKDQHWLPHHILKKGRESMRADTFLKLPIETVDCETLAPTRLYGVSGQGFFYCYVVFPLHSIGVSHENRSAGSWPWASPSRPFKHVDDSFWKGENFGQKAHSPTCLTMNYCCQLIDDKNVTK